MKAEIEFREKLRVGFTEKEIKEIGFKIKKGSLKVIWAENGQNKRLLEARVEKISNRNLFDLFQKPESVRFDQGRIFYFTLTLEAYTFLKIDGKVIGTMNARSYASGMPKLIEVYKLIAPLKKDLNTYSRSPHYTSRK